MGGDPIKTIVEAGKGNIDFIAFALIAVLAVGAVGTGTSFWPVAATAITLTALWVIMRYALLEIQSRERLRDMRERATIEAQKKLEKYATEDEIADLFKDLEREGAGDEH